MNFAFYGTSLTRVTIPASVTSIDNVAFGNCVSLVSVTFEGQIPSNRFGDNIVPEDLFPLGDLREKYLAGGIGTYTRASGSTTWTKQATTPTNTNYIITGSGTSFTATRDGATVSSGGIQTVIETIRTHAKGTNPTIQFGNGDVLDIGTSSIEFNNQMSWNGQWTTVTLTGKITSAVNSNGTIHNDVYITSTADIKNTSNVAICNNSGAFTISGGTISGTIKHVFGTVNITGGTINGRITNDSNGTINISGGTVSTTSAAAAVYNWNGGTVSITGGTVSSTSTSGIALESDRNGKVFVSGTAKITSSTTNSTINLVGGSRLEMTGGTIENTSTDTGYAIHSSNGSISITGGTVSKAGSSSGYAVWNSSGTVTIGPGATIVGRIFGL